MNNNNTKTSPEVFPSKVTSLGEERRRKAMRRTSTKMKIRNEQQQHKHLTGGFPKQSNIAGSF